MPEFAPDLKILAHDLRQPLQSISLLNAALQNVTQQPEILKIAAMQRESLDRMCELIDQLDFPTNPG